MALKASMVSGPLSLEVDGQAGLDPVTLPKGDVVYHCHDHSAQTVSLVPSFAQAAFPACTLGR